MITIKLLDSLKESELKEAAQHVFHERWKVFVTDEDRARNPDAFGMTVREREEAVNQAEEWFAVISSVLINNYVDGYSE